jgi:hypothetical protein
MGSGNLQRGFSQHSYGRFLRVIADYIHVPGILGSLDVMELRMLNCAAFYVWVSASPFSGGASVVTVLEGIFVSSQHSVQCLMHRWLQ